MFLDVRFERNEILVDEIRYFRVGVRLGFQPSARASSRCCAEINEQRFLALLSLRERRVSIFVPLDSHLLLPPELKFERRFPRAFLSFCIYQPIIFRDADHFRFYRLE
jgi:hypothetical protein